MIFRNTKYIASLFFLFAFLLLPGIIHAQSVSVETRATVETDESIVASVYVQTGGQSINTVSGSITFQSSEVTISDIRYGNSIISLWVDKPTATNSEIRFTGGIPGGFSGAKGILFTFVAKPKNIGQVSFGVQDVHILLNNGTGEEMQGVKAVPGVVQVVPDSGPVKSIKTSTGSATGVKSITATSTSESEVAPVVEPDVIAPETFIPLVGHHPSISDDAYFVSFFAVDKDSGIERYEVRETPTLLTLFGGAFATKWAPAVSPYVLTYQKWGSRVEVKAYDQSGNFAISKVNKPFEEKTYAVLVIVVIGLVVLITRRMSLRKHIHKKKI